MVKSIIIRKIIRGIPRRMPRRVPQRIPQRIPHGDMNLYARYRLLRESLNTFHQGPNVLFANQLITTISLLGSFSAGTIYGIEYLQSLGILDTSNYAWLSEVFRWDVPEPVIEPEPITIDDLPANVETIDYMNDLIENQKTSDGFSHPEEGNTPGDERMPMIVGIVMPTLRNGVFKRRVEIKQVLVIKNKRTLVVSTLKIISWYMYNIPFSLRDFYLLQ